MPKKISERIFGLDVIRAVAILLVMVSHSAMLMLPSENTRSVLSFFKFFGAIGVDLFFVLSGFLIGGILLKHIQKEHTSLKDLLHFWVRRWFRTLPNYFLILIINILFFYLLNGIVFNQLGEFFLFIQNFASRHPEFFTEAWSLSIEEYAYIIGPLLILGLVYVLRIKDKSALFLTMTFFVIALIFFNRFHYYLNNDFSDYPDWSRNIRKVVIYRIDSIYFGFIAAYIANYFSQFWFKIKYVAFIFGSVLFIGMHACIMFCDLRPENEPVFYTLFYLPLVSISLLSYFPFFSNWKTGRFFSKSITRLSKISYSLYLVNLSLVFLPLYYFVEIELSSLLIKIMVFIVYWLASFLFANALYRFFEKPMMNFREHPKLISYFKQ